MAITFANNLSAVGISAATDWPVPYRVSSTVAINAQAGVTAERPSLFYRALGTSKFLGYAVVSPPAKAVSVSKLLGYAVLQPMPFWRFDPMWPNPRGRPYPLSLRTHIQPLSYIGKTTLAAVSPVTGAFVLFSYSAAFFEMPGALSLGAQQTASGTVTTQGPIATTITVDHAAVTAAVQPLTGAKAFGILGGPSFGMPGTMPVSSIPGAPTNRNASLSASVSGIGISASATVQTHMSGSSIIVLTGALSTTTTTDNLAAFPVVQPVVGAISTSIIQQIAGSPLAVESIEDTSTTQAVAGLAGTLPVSPADASGTVVLTEALAGSPRIQAITDTITTVTPEQAAATPLVLAIGEHATTTIKQHAAGSPAILAVTEAAKATLLDSASATLVIHAVTDLAAAKAGLRAATTFDVAAITEATIGLSVDAVSAILNFSAVAGTKTTKTVDHAVGISGRASISTSSSGVVRSALSLISHVLPVQLAAAGEDIITLSGTLNCEAIDFTSASTILDELTASAALGPLPVTVTAMGFDSSAWIVVAIDPLEQGGSFAVRDDLGGSVGSSITVDGIFLPELYRRLIVSQMRRLVN